jgi:hypothetical protein
MIADGRTILLGFLGVESFVWLSFALSAYGRRVDTRYPLLEAKPQSALIDLLARTFVLHV